ncbi:MAG: hypothetical protein D6741_00660 [Planctomycetota bacterium]|nr:MAG: hypothetical protein D6741_00660 [Planctomycetota bacterium]
MDGSAPTLESRVPEPHAPESAAEPAGWTQPTADDELQHFETSSVRRSTAFWAIEERLAHLERLLESAPVESRSARRKKRYRVDAGHEVRIGPHRPRHRSPNHVTADDISAWFTWPILAIGLMATVCGAVLEGWSILASRPELSNYGIPIALCGIVVLLIGLVFQMDRLGQVGESTARKLSELDEALADVDLEPLDDDLELPTVPPPRGIRSRLSRIDSELTADR